MGNRSRGIRGNDTVDGGLVLSDVEEEAGDFEEGVLVVEALLDVGLLLLLGVEGAEETDAAGEAALLLDLREQVQLEIANPSGRIPGTSQRRPS